MRGDITMQASSWYVVIALCALAIALVFAACGGVAAKPAVVECDGALVAKLAPLVREAVEARDYARLAALLVDFGVESYACAHRELAKQVPSDAPTGKDGAL